MSWKPSLRTALRRTPTVVAILSVLTLYAYFGGGGSFNFRRLHSAEDSLYASLAEGFSRGHLSMASTPDPRLARLPNPYDPAARGGIDYLWDASYLNGKYYLYFSPLPALIFYMPYRIVRGAYPPDTLAGVVFSSWAFLAAVAFTYRALFITQNARRRHVPFALWVLFIGCGGVGVFVLAEVRIYEVAIMAGMAMTATWAYALVRFVQSPTAAAATWTGVWLALAVDARPNLGVLIFVTAAAVVSSVKGRSLLLKRLFAAFVPLAAVAAAMLWYNAARFGKPGEFGLTYQLTAASMRGRAACRLCSFPELMRFANNSIHYVFWPLTVHSDFPFVNLSHSELDPDLSLTGSEQVVGVAPLVPLTILGTFFAFLFALRVEGADEGTRAAVYAMAGAWLIMAGLSSCWYVVVRYELEFMLLMTAATVICVESGFDLLGNLHIRMGPVRVATAVLACYSTLAGFLLGFVGRDHAFERLHPELSHRIAQWIGMVGESGTSEGGTQIYGDVEQVLLPIAGTTGNQEAAAHTRWRVDQTIRNNGDHRVRLTRTNCEGAPECEVEIGPGESVRIAGSDPISRFVYVAVPRETIDSIAFTTVVHRVDQDIPGSDFVVPAIRAWEFRKGHLQIDGVLFSPTEHWNLRLYAGARGRGPATVRIQKGALVLAERVVPIYATSFYSHGDLRALFADLAPLDERVSITVEAEPLIWGFIIGTDAAGRSTVYLPK